MITLDEVIAKGQSIIKDNDKHVYQPVEGRCLYIKDGQPSCIAAKVLSSLEVSNDVLQSWDNEAESAIRIVFHNGKGQVDIEPAALDFLGDLQAYQDMLLNWGESFRRAKATADEYRRNVTEEVDSPDDDVLGSVQPLIY